MELGFLGFGGRERGRDQEFGFGHAESEIMY